MNSRPVPARAEYEAVLGELQQRTGLTFPAHQRELVGERLHAAWKRSGRPAWHEYRSAIRSGGVAFETLVSELTVGETYFFRDPEVFRFIRARVLPELGCRKLRFWSAGCASGEEAYSLAILLLEAGLAAEPTILGTDISRDRLDRARRGLYSRWSLRGLSPGMVQSYFRRSGGRYRLSDEVRRRVSFRRLYLAAGSYPSVHTCTRDMDVVLCRNVLIYLDDRTVDDVVGRLLDSLRPGGWLVIGASDPMPKGLSSCEMIATGQGFAFRRSCNRIGIHRGGARVEVPAPSELTNGPTLAAGAAKEAKTAPEAVGADTPAIESGAPATTAENFEQKLARSAPEAPGEDSWEARVQVLADRGRLVEAERTCAVGLEEYPASARLLCLQARLWSASGRYAHAVHAARRALYLDRSLVMAHLALGRACMGEGNTGAALQALKNADGLLSRMSPDEPVAGGGEQTAEDLTRFVRLQMRLLGESE